MKEREEGWWDWPDLSFRVRRVVIREWEEDEGQWERFVYGLVWRR